MVREWLENCTGGSSCKSPTVKEDGCTDWSSSVGCPGAALYFLCVCVNDLNEGIESIFNKFTHNSKLRGNRIPNELDELQKALPTPPQKHAILLVQQIQHFNR